MVQTNPTDNDIAGTSRGWNYLGFTVRKSCGFRRLKLTTPEAIAIHALHINDNNVENAIRDLGHVVAALRRRNMVNVFKFKRELLLWKHYQLLKDAHVKLKKMR